MEDCLDETSDRKDLADFLAKVDEIGAARLVYLATHAEKFVCNLQNNAWEQSSLSKF